MINKVFYLSLKKKKKKNKTPLFHYVLFQKAEPNSPNEPCRSIENVKTEDIHEPSRRRFVQERHNMRSLIISHM